MGLAIDVYWSFRSPYSYLVTPKLNALRDEYNVDLRIRPVLPIAVRIDGFFEQVNPLWGPYLVRDILRLGQMQGTPIRWPRPDPIVMNYAEKTVAKDQPYIFDLVRRGQAASEAGRGLEYVTEVSRLIWSGETENWHEGDLLDRAAERAGLDARTLARTAREEVERLDEAIAGNQRTLEAAGHWGVPTMVFDGEPFFGQDRVDALVWRMKQAGLKPRAS